MVHTAEFRSELKPELAKTLKLHFPGSIDLILNQTADHLASKSERERRGRFPTGLAGPAGQVPIENVSDRINSAYQSQGEAFTPTAQAQTARPARLRDRSGYEGHCGAHPTARKCDHGNNRQRCWRLSR